MPAGEKGDMRGSFHNVKRLWAALVVAVAMGAPVAHAAIVDLDAYVLQPILGGDGVTPLADGSWVFIIGSGDGVLDPMQQFGPYYDAYTTTGDDVILGIVQIDSSLGPGTFATTVQYDSATINYAYIRFFDTTSNLIAGPVYWGTSSVFALGVTLGVSTVQFDDNNQLVATNYNTFVVIPEPGTANLLLLVGGMIWAMRSSMGRKKKKKDAEAVQGDE